MIRFALGVVFMFLLGTAVGFYLVSLAPKSPKTVEVQVCASIPLGRGVLTRCYTTEVHRDILQELEEDGCYAE